MKTIAYICDDCNGLFLEDGILGLNIIQPDLFKGIYEYETGKGYVDKFVVHFCTGCFNKRVIDLCKGIDRSKDEKEYTYMYELYRKKFFEGIHIKSLIRKNKRK